MGPPGLAGSGPAACARARNACLAATQNGFCNKRPPPCCPICEGSQHTNRMHAGTRTAGPSSRQARPSTPSRTRRAGCCTRHRPTTPTFFPRWDRRRCWRAAGASPPTCSWWRRRSWRAGWGWSSWRRAGGLAAHAAAQPPAAGDRMPAWLSEIVRMALPLPASLYLIRRRALDRPRHPRRHRRLFPPFSDIRRVSIRLAARLAAFMVEQGLGREPEGFGGDWEAHVAASMWCGSGGGRGLRRGSCE